MLVDGEAMELLPSNAEVQKVGDRWYVRTPDGTHSSVVVRQGTTTYVSFRGRQYRVEPLTRARAKAKETASGEARALMPGLVVDVRQSMGDKVSRGDTIVVVEAMKTQQPFNAPFDGTVTSLGVTKGQQVAEGMVLFVVTPEAP